MSITTFKFHNSIISSLINVNGNIWFFGKEVAIALGYKKPLNALSKYIKDNEKMLYNNFPLLPQFGAGGGKINIVKKSHHKKNNKPINKKYNSKTQWLINEPGLYRLVFSSKMPFAEQFKDWVFTWVLPTLRKTQSLSKISLHNEANLHYNIVSYFKLVYYDYKIIPGLGEYQDSSTKRIDASCKGYYGGQPDLLFPYTTSKYNGLSIELKNPNGKGIISYKQAMWKNHLLTNGWLAIIYNNRSYIIEQINNYMEQVKLSCQKCRKYYKTQKWLKNHFLAFPAK